MTHNAHLIDVSGPDGLAAAARLAGFAWSGAGDSPPAAAVPGAALRMDHLDEAQAGALRQATGEGDLPPVLEPASGAGPRRLLLPGDRSRFAALAAALRPSAPSLSRAVAELLGADARRAWTWRIRGRTLRAGVRTLVMGVLNVTPDSFSDGGRYRDPGRAVARGLEMAEAGADLVDVGGESTRPGARRVSALEERERVIPVIRALARQTDVSLSVDTSRAAVAREALDAGARVINDISALTFDAEMAGVVGRGGAGLVVMHMQGTPESMQQAPAYRDILGEVLAFLRRALARATRAGIAAEQVVVDPGIGFGKSLAHNLALLRHAGSLRALGRPVLVGASRKSFLGEITNRPVDQRLAGSLAALAAAVASGAALVRVHDVAETVDAVRILQAIRQGGAG